MDPWPDKWLVDDWADQQLLGFTSHHGNRGRLQCLSGRVDWVGPFTDFNILRDGTARGPITIISIMPTEESEAVDDDVMLNFETMYEVMTPPTRIATESGFLINGTYGLYLIKAPHDDGAPCSHRFCQWSAD